MGQQSGTLVEEGRQRLSIFSWTLAAMIATLVCMVQLGVMVSLMASRAAFSSVFPVSVLIALAVGCVLLQRAQFAARSILIACGIFLLAIAASLALSAFFFDFSWDGQWYHQTAIIHIARDWNPLFDPMHSFPAHLETWERHYAKGSWYFAAAVFRATGHIEWGKAINWLSLAAAFFAVLAACLNFGLRLVAAFSLAALTACNPVVMSELTTYLVDAVMISFLVVAAAALCASWSRPSAPTLFAGVAAAIATTNAKFTGLVYLCFALAAGLVWCFLHHRQWLIKYVGVTALTLFLATCVWGFNPYVTNVYYRSQPFYPMLGSRQYPSLEQANKDGNEKYETPKNMVGRSLFVRFGYSIFGRPGNQPYAKGRTASLMWPFTATLDDLYAYKYHETRVAGFGPFFSGCFILAVVLGFLVGFAAPEARSPLALMAVAIISSLFLSRHLWWPRYGPQLWLLPILPAGFVLAQRVSGYKLVLAHMLLILLFANTAIVSFIRLQWETNASITLRRQLAELRDSGQTYEVQTNRFQDSWNVRLQEAGVNFVDVGMQKLPGGQELMSVVEQYPLAIHYRILNGGVPTTIGSKN